MKILGGKLKGRNIYMPFGIRPTQNIVRKALFDVLGQDLEGLAFLDLFAGSGAVGLEAISRGAKAISFVDHDPKCIKVIEDNIHLLKIDSLMSISYEVIHNDALGTIKYLARKQRKFDIIFIDPPYGLELSKKALKLLMAYDILHPASFVVIQHEKRETLPESTGRFLVLREKQYGNSVLSIYKLI